MDKVLLGMMLGFSAGQFITIGTKSWIIFFIAWIITFVIFLINERC